MWKALILFLIATATGTWLGHSRYTMPEFAGPTLHIAFIDVEQGDSILIQTPDRRAALIDAGGKDDGDRVASFLRTHGVTRLDLLILTHTDADHIGGAPETLSSFKVDHVLDCGCSYGGGPQDQTLRRIHEQNIPYGAACSGQIFHLGDLTTIQVLLPESPLSPNRSNANNNCIVARVSFGGVSTLLLSDIGPGEEAQLVANNPDLACDVLKVSRHGSSRTTSNELLRMAKPEYAVITVGSGRDRARPSRGTLSRLEAAGAKVLRTDDYGTVIVATDGRRIQVTGEH